MATAIRKTYALGEIERRCAAVTEWAFWNGRQVALRQAVIPFKASAAHYAGAIFDGLRCSRRGIFLLPEHAERFRLSWETVRLAVPDGCDSLDQFLREFWDQGQMTVALNEGQNSYVRPWAGRGVRQSNRSGLHVRSWHRDPMQRVGTLYGVATEEWPSYINTDDGGPVIALLVRHIERPTRRCGRPFAKTIANYLLGTEVSDLACDMGAHEGMMGRAQPDGTFHVLDGPGQAIAIVERVNGEATIVTPDPERSDILRSTQLMWFFNDVAPRVGVAWTFGDLTPDRVFLADELLYIGSATGIVSFNVVWDGSPQKAHVIGTGKPGPVYGLLRQEYDRAMNGTDQGVYEMHFTPVPSKRLALRAVAERYLREYDACDDAREGEEILAMLNG